MGGEQPKAKAFGLLTHKLLEKGWNWNQAQLEKAALAWASTWSLPEEKAREAAQLVFKALGQELFQRARRSNRVFREVPLAGKLPTAGFLNAIVDLAFLEGDQWVLVDYKTDRELGKHQEDYRQQMDYYRQLLEHLTGYRVKETFLYFIRHQQIETVPI
jgi:ATP-dependent exoDNAse (exonuclease V) beta subunit